MVGIELLSILTPYLFVAVQHGCEYGHIHMFLDDTIFTANNLFARTRIEREGRRGRIEAQRLFENLRDVLELIDLREGGINIEITPQHAIYFSTGFCQHSGIAQKFVNGKGE